MEYNENRNYLWNNMSIIEDSWFVSSNIRLTNWATSKSPGQLKTVSQNSQIITHMERKLSLEFEITLSEYFGGIFRNLLSI